MLLKARRDTSLYKLLEAQANVATRTAEAFQEMVVDFSNIQTFTKHITDLEHEGDELTHELQNRIASTFITPLDKEDLRDLSSALDDVTDYIEAAAARAELYRVDSPRSEIQELARLLVKITKLTEEAVAELRNGFRKSTRLDGLLMEIHTVENASDKLFRQALSDLFHEPGIDALTVIKWKELFDRVETAVDKCEDIAAIIGTIVVKYA